MKDKGVVLLLISGVVTILVLLSLAILQTTRVFGARAAARAGAAQAMLAAASGMDYAAARLCQDSMPGVWSLSGRGDDWSERQGSDNPSYSHGEAWIEDGTPDGIFTSNETQHADRDGDERFSAWSGRIRGGAGPLALRFALRVESLEGRIPLNAGFLGGGGPYHDALALVLDNLGAMLLDPATGTRRWDVPTSGDPILASWLGQDLIGSRPGTGYRSLKQIRETMLLLGYPPDECDRVAPYLDLGPYGLPRDSVRWGGILNVPSDVPINLWTAPQRVLESVWRYVTTRNPATFDPITSQYLQDELVPEADGMDEISPFTNLAFSAQRMVLFPVEAERLALETIAFRKGGQRGWAPFRKRLMDRASFLFQEEFNTLANATPAPADRMKWGWAAAKANLAFLAVCEDPLESKGLRPGMLWEAWPPTLDANPQAPGRQNPPFIQFALLSRLAYPPGGYDRGNPDPWAPSSPSYPFFDSVSGPGIGAQGLSLAPPLRFAVESRAGGAGLAGDLQAGERLCLTSQEDFENLTGGDRFKGGGGWGISVLETPGFPITLRRDAPSGYAPRTATLPRYNRRALVATPGSDPLAAPLYGFSRSYGAIGLGTVEELALPAGPFLHWPIVEDFDAQNTLTPGPAHKEFWSSHSLAVNPAWNALPLGFQPPFRLPANLALNPYGFVTPGGIYDLRPAWLEYFSPPISARYQVLDQLSIEARVGIGSRIEMKRTAGTQCGLLLSTRRGFRPGVLPVPDRWGTELTLSCRWTCGEAGQTGSIKQQTWFIPDGDVGGAWSYHVVLSAQREAVGSYFKTRFKLWVNGVNQLPPEPPMELLWDATPASEDGQMVIGFFSMFPPNPRRYAFPLAFTNVDDIRFHASALASLAYGPRHVDSGTFTSPLYSFDAPVKLRQAQWTGAVPPGGAISVQVTGYDDPWGGSPIAPALPPLGPDTEVSSLGEMPPVRAFRYAVRLDRPPAQAAPAMDETPVFESIWFTLQRRGSSPAWTAWESR